LEARACELVRFVRHEVRIEDDFFGVSVAAADRDGTTLVTVHISVADRPTRTFEGVAVNAEIVGTASAATALGTSAWRHNIDAKRTKTCIRC
jgi:hypothetical protein